MHSCLVWQEVVEFCKSYLVVNKEAFRDPRLEVIINDARSANQIVTSACWIILNHLCHKDSIVNTAIMTNSNKTCHVAGLN